MELAPQEEIDKFLKTFYKQIPENLITDDGSNFEILDHCKNLFHKTREMHRIINYDWLANNLFIVFTD